MDKYISSPTRLLSSFKDGYLVVTVRVETLNRIIRNQNRDQLNIITQNTIITIVRTFGSCLSQEKRRISMSFFLSVMLSWEMSKGSQVESLGMRYSSHMYFFIDTVSRGSAIIIVGNSFLSFDFSNLFSFILCSSPLWNHNSCCLKRPQCCWMVSQLRASNLVTVNGRWKDVDLYRIKGISDPLLSISKQYDRSSSSVQLIHQWESIKNLNDSQLNNLMMWSWKYSRVCEHDTSSTRSY